MMRNPLPPLASNDLLGIAARSLLRAENGDRYRNNDSHNSRANVRADETQDNKQPFRASGPDEIIRHHDWPSDTKKETEIVNPDEASFPSVCAQPPTDDPELRRPM